MLSYWETRIQTFFVVSRASLVAYNHPLLARCTIDFADILPFKGVKRLNPLK